MEYRKTQGYVRQSNYTELSAEQLSNPKHTHEYWENQVDEIGLENVRRAANRKSGNMSDYSPFIAGEVVDRREREERELAAEEAKNKERSQTIRDEDFLAEERKANVLSEKAITVSQRAVNISLLAFVVSLGAFLVALLKK